MNWENVKSRIAAPLFYTAVFAVFLILFVINGIDANALGAKLESLIEKNSTAAVKIGSAGLSLPASLTLSDVTLDDKAGTRLKFDNLSLRPLFLPLLTGSPTLRIVARTTNGELVVDLSTAGFDTKLRRINVTANDVAIHEIVLSAGGAPLPVNGEISGSGGLLFPAGSTALPESTGSLEITVNNVRISAAVPGRTLLKNLSPKKASCKIALVKRKLTTSRCGDRKSTRLNSSHTDISRMPSSA